jgi:hypothetical protein
MGRVHSEANPVTGGREDVTRLIDAAMSAVNDPGQFTMQGTDNEGGLFGEPINAWQRRALGAALIPVLASLSDERLAQAEAKVERVEAAMAAFEKDVANPGVSWVSTGMRALYNFRAALSGEETT